jgi:hypothetical protein
MVELQFLLATIMVVDAAVMHFLTDKEVAYV